MKILVIDDSEDDRLLYQRSLQKDAGQTYHIQEADNGEKGIGLLGAEEPACILLDYSLPGYNGIEILKRIRTAYPFVAVVMLTGQGNENIAVAAMREGAQNYIVKSTITAETLQHVVRMGVEHCAMQKRIDEHRSSLEVFIHALAHDLKQPLRTIISYSQLIDKYERLSEKAKGHFLRVQNAAERMNVLIDTVFLYTRLANSDFLVEEGPAREDCDTMEVLKEVQENIALLIAEHGATIVAEALPIVHVNRIQLLQLLQNLICNSIHYCKGKVVITLSVRPEGKQWLFQVADNGPGIDEAYLQAIFQPFKRFAHRDEQSYGLGLAICKKIVELHGGKIWCESKSGEGATFLFTLPSALGFQRGSKEIA